MTDLELAFALLSAREQEKFWSTAAEAERSPRRKRRFLHYAAQAARRAGRPWRGVKWHGDSVQEHGDYSWILASAPSRRRRYQLSRHPF